MDKETCPSYLILAEGALRNELQRVDSYFYPSTKPKMVQAVRHELLKSHQLELMDKPSGISAMLEGVKSEVQSLQSLFIQRVC